MRHQLPLATLFAAMLIHPDGARSAAQAQPDDGDTADSRAVLDRVEVVGTRIKRVDLETSQPVFVLERAQLERTGLTSVGDILQDLTAHGAALNTTFNNGGDGTTRVDLRNLGDNRTLVLVDGRRWIAGIDGAVDLNSIPLAIIERIEVLKDGASAIYGSDAIAGVVNIVTRTDFSGIETRAYIGQFEQGDGLTESYEISVGTLGERGSSSLSLSYLRQDEIFAGEREISAVPTFGLPGNDIRVTGVAGSTTPFGSFGFGALGVCPFNPSGVYPENACPSPDGRPPTTNRSTYDPITGGWRLLDVANDGYNFAPLNYLQTPQERLALFARGRYALGETASFAYDLLYNKRRSAQELAPQPVMLGIVLRGGGRHVVPAAHIYNPFGQPVTALWVRPGEQSRQFRQDADTLRIGAGIDGTLDFAGRTWWWDLDVAHADYDIAQITEGLPDLARVRQALGPSFFDANGTARCGTPNAVIAGCVPLDAFRGPAAVTPSMLDWILRGGAQRTRTRSQLYGLNVSGDLASLPAGTLAVAAGLEHRRERGERDIDPLLVALQNALVPSFGGRVEVSEAFTEFAIPLLAERPGAQLLDANVAARWSRYDTFGNTSNLEAGLRWKPSDDLMWRASYSEGFRAPNVTELFSPQSIGVDGFRADPCNVAMAPSPSVRANCVADGVPGGSYAGDGVFDIRTGGNPDLQPETALTRTTGVVWSPSWLEGFDLSLDWYRIEIEDASAVSAYAGLLANCAVAGVPEACARTSRNASGELLEVDARRLNSGKLEVEGYDLTASWRGDTPIGQIEALWDSTYTSRYLFEVPRGAPVRSAVGNYRQSEPGFRIRSNLDVAWRRDRWSAAVGMRWYSALDEACVTPVSAGFAELCSNPAIASPSFFGQAENRIGSRTYVDLQLGFELPWSGRATVGLNNAFDRDPPIAYSAFANSFDPSYPIPGRFWYLRWEHVFD